MNYKKNARSKFYITILIILTAILFCIHPVNADKSGDTNKNQILLQKTSKNKKELSSKIIAYYFHGIRRCRTCIKIESTTRSVIQDKFKNEFKNGTLEWQTVNVDREENKHFIKKYNLYTRSVVLVKIKAGKQSDWKNLEKVWQLIHKDDSFKKYIIDEVKTFLG